MSTYEFKAPDGPDKLRLFLTAKAAKALEKKLRKSKEDDEGFWVVTEGTLSQGETEKPKPRARKSSRGS